MLWQLLFNAQPCFWEVLVAAVLTAPSTEMHWVRWSLTRPHTGATYQDSIHLLFQIALILPFYKFSYFRIVFLLYSIWKSARYKQYLCQIIISNKYKNRYPTLANVENRGRKKNLKLNYIWSNVQRWTRMSVTELNLNSRILRAGGVVVVEHAWVLGSISASPNTYSHIHAYIGTYTYLKTYRHIPMAVCEVEFDDLELRVFYTHSSFPVWQPLSSEALPG